MNNSFDNLPNPSDPHGPASNPYADRGATAGEDRSVARTSSRGAEVSEFYRKLIQATPRVYVTHILVALNVALFVAMVLGGVHIMSPATADLIQWGANYGPQTLAGQWWRLVSCTFVHIGVIHLAINMWVLWDIGRLVERLVGNVGFLLLYLFSGLFGSITSVYWNPQVVSAGASGAVFGMFGVLVGFLMLNRRSVPTIVAKEFRRSGLTLLLYVLIVGALVPWIDNAAHLGGFAAGFVGGLVASQSLDGHVAFGRLLRNAMILLGGTGLVGLAIAATPPAPLNLAYEMDRIGVVYNVASNDNLRGEISDAQLADTIENRVLASWADLQQQIDRAAQRGAITADDCSQLQEYMKLREQSWQAQIAALRTGDAAKMTEHLQFWNAADRQLENVKEQLR